MEQQTQFGLIQLSEMLLHLTLKLEETLVPPADSEGSAITLDGTYTNVNDIAWTVELSDLTDIFVGRDSVADSVSTTGYLPGIETVIATAGNDEIDGGGGYNVADFSQMDAHYLDFDMASGEVSFIHNSQNTNQNWYGFQEVL